MPPTIDAVESFRILYQKNKNNSLAFRSIDYKTDQSIFRGFI